MFEIESIDQYLYHYTSREVGLENILGEMKIRFSSYAKTNDPQESGTPEFSWSNVNGEKLGGAPLYYHNQMYTYPKLLCFSQDSPEYFNLIMKDNRVYREHNTIYRGFSRVRLWATCADNHRGMCFVFDKQALLNSVSDAFKKTPLSLVALIILI